MNNMVSKIWSLSLLRNIGKLLTANVIAQAIGLLVYPVLTRLYAPEDFGLLNLFVSIGGVLVILSTMEWNKAVVLPKREAEARALTHLSLISIGIWTILIVLTIPFAKPIAGIFNSPELTSYYWLIPVYVSLVGVWNILNYWFIRRQEYNSISRFMVGQSLFSVSYTYGFGFCGCLGGGLIYSTILSTLCSLIITIMLSAKRRLHYLCAWDGNACRQVAITYRNFPKYSLPHSLINNIAGQLPVLLLTPFFGTRLVGFWGMAILLSFAPINMMTNVLHQVLYPKTTDYVYAGCSIASFYRRFTLLSISVIVPLFIVLWFVLPWFTQWLLGSEWCVTGQYIRWMLPWLLCMFLCASTGYLFDIFSKQKHGLYFEIIIAIARLAGLVIGIYFHNFTLAIACYAIASAVINGIQYFWLMRLVKKYEDSLSHLR